MPNSPKIFIFILSYLLITHSPLAQNLVLAKSLNDSAVALMMKSEKNEKVIELLDQAISADSNYAKAYENKMSFLLNEKKYSNALVLSNKLLSINPKSSIYNLTTGVLLEKTGSIFEAQKKYKIADSLLSSSIDTLKTTDPKYVGQIWNRITTLTLLNNPIKAKELANSLHSTGIKSELDDLTSELISKSREEILNSILQTKE